LEAGNVMPLQKILRMLSLVHQLRSKLFTAKKNGEHRLACEFRVVGWPQHGRTRRQEIVVSSRLRLCIQTVIELMQMCRAGGFKL
jgi:hypothetical protein